MKGLVLSSLLILSIAAEVVEQSDELEARGENGAALAILRAANERAPGDSEVLRRLARQYVQQMDAPGADSSACGRRALDHARQAVAAGPKNAEAHLALAIVSGQVAFLQPPQERLAFSRLIKQEAETALELDPKNDLAWHVLGRWHYEVANLGAPLKFLAQTLYGKMPAASNEQALACFEKARVLRPDRLLHQAELGRTLAALGREDEARAALEKALAMPLREKDDPETKTRARKALQALD